MTMQDDKIEHLRAYLKGKLSGDEAKAVARELHSDPELARLYVVLKGLDHQAEEADSGGLGPAARKLASSLIKEFLGNIKTDGPPRGVPVFDSRLLPIPDGVRPATVDTCRLSYRIDNLEVDLSLYPVSPDRYEMIGQIIGWTGDRLASVQLRSGRQRQSATCDDYGVFRFPTIAVGRHSLAVRHHKKTLGVIQLEL